MALSSLTSQITNFLALISLSLLDLVAIAALVVAVRNEKPFPPPLLVGYALTAIGGLTMLLLWFQSNSAQYGFRGIWI